MWVKNIKNNLIRKSGNVRVSLGAVWFYMGVIFTWCSELILHCPNRWASNNFIFFEDSEKGIKIKHPGCIWGSVLSASLKPTIFQNCNKLVLWNLYSFPSYPFMKHNQDSIQRKRKMNDSPPSCDCFHTYWEKLSLPSSKEFLWVAKAEEEKRFP